jgi:hypothetical protein
MFFGARFAFELAEISEARKQMRRKTLERARKAKREGKAPTTQAGEFVHEEIEHVRRGKHGARSTKQAIAIGLSKARRAGVRLKAAEKGTDIGSHPQECRTRLSRRPKANRRTTVPASVAGNVAGIEARTEGRRIETSAFKASAFSRATTSTLVAMSESRV